MKIPFVRLACGGKLKKVLFRFRPVLARVVLALVADGDSLAGREKGAEAFVALDGGLLCFSYEFESGWLPDPL